MLENLLTLCAILAGVAALVAGLLFLRLFGGMRCPGCRSLAVETIAEDMRSVRMRCAKCGVFFEVRKR